MAKVGLITNRYKGTTQLEGRIFFYIDANSRQYTLKRRSLEGL